MHTDTHPLTRNLRVRSQAARHQTLKPRLREHRGRDPHVRSDPIAERVRKDLENVLRVGRLARVDVTMSCSEKCYSRAHEWPETGMGRPALWSMSTSVPTLPPSKLFSSQSFYRHSLPCHGGSVRGQIRNSRTVLAAFSPWARRREGAPETLSAPYADRDRLETAFHQAQARLSGHARIRQLRQLSWFTESGNPASVRCWNALWPLKRSSFVWQHFGTGEHASRVDRKSVAGNQVCYCLEIVLHLLIMADSGVRPPKCIGFSRLHPKSAANV